MVRVGKDGRISSGLATQSSALNHLITVYNANESTNSRMDNEQTIDSTEEEQLVGSSSSSAATRSATLLLSELRSDVKETDLLPLFGHAISRIVEIDIPMSDVGVGLGYAHVVFEFAAAADAALNLLGGPNSIVQVGNKGTARVSKSQTAISSSLEDFRLYMGRLPLDVTYEEVKEYLCDLWKLALVREYSKLSGIEKDIDNEKCPINEIRLCGGGEVDIGKGIRYRRRYCLVNLGDVWNNTERLMSAYQDQIDKSDICKLNIRGIIPWLKDIRDRPIDTTLNGPYNRETKINSASASSCYSSTLGIIGLTDHVTEIELIKLFSEFGPIEGVKFYPMKHMAYLRFAKVSAAIAAKLELTDFPIRGVPIRIQWAATHNGDQSFLQPLEFSNNIPSLFTSKKRDQTDLQTTRQAIISQPHNSVISANSSSIKSWANQIVEMANRNSINNQSETAEK